MIIPKKILSLSVFAPIVFSFVFIATGAAHAATFSIATDNNSVSIGQPIQVDVTLDTQGKSVNTVQSKILVPSNLFQITAVNDGASIVSFWIVPPAASSSGEINLAGVVPGGYDGPSGSLVSFILTPIASGEGDIGIATATVLANDGNGSALPVTLTRMNISVGSSIYTGSSTAEQYSGIAPELFTPVVTSDPNVFNGAFFLVFSAIDKGSGIDHYEVLETPTNPSSRVTPSWQAAVSPYLLQDQSLSSNIYVRAVNHNGAYLVVELPARYSYNAVAVGSRIAFSITAFCVLVAIFALYLLFLALRAKRKRRSPEV